MTILKPIENLLIDMSFSLKEDETPLIEDYGRYGLFNNKEYIIGFDSHINIKISDNLTIVDIDGFDIENYISIGKKADDILLKPINHISHSDIKELHSYVVNYNNNYSDFAKIEKEIIK